MGLNRKRTMNHELKDQLSKQGIHVTSLESIYNWARSNSMWPLQFGLACCAIEMIAATMARHDLARFGAEIFRPSPRQLHSFPTRRSSDHRKSVV